MDKVAFWKKDEDLGDPFADMRDPLGKDPFGQDFGRHEPLGHQAPQQFQQPQFQQQFQNQSMSQLTKPLTNPEPQFNPSQPFQQLQQEKTVNHDILQKDIEIISTKLDSLKMSLESMNQRLQNIEQIQREERARKW